jgi:hypothetical protein
MAYRTDLDLVDEHAEVLADRDERPMLVVHLHAQTVRGLRNLGNREAGPHSDISGRFLLRCTGLACYT